MDLRDFDFALPSQQIARHPLERRDASRLLVLRHPSGEIRHRSFRDLPELLSPSDILVLNETRVFPARVVGRKQGTLGRAELLLVRPKEAIDTTEALARPAEGQLWTCLGQATKGLRADTVVEMRGFSARVVSNDGEGEYTVRFSGGDGESLNQILAAVGELPLPPYLERAPDAQDETRYQTVFAKEHGSVAAPTAGLHFTPETFEALRSRGVGTATCCLDVGPGTFLPVRDNIAQHRMHLERYELPQGTCRRIVEARARGGRLVAVGTTVVRTLESATHPQTGVLQAGRGDTRLFIRPGFRFRQTEILLTNFHLPRSTLLMLVCALAGRENVLAAYGAAVNEGYRFFSYGDAMLVLPDRIPS